ncbi:methionine synthase II (cobalamin-independent) [Nocardioides aromaticivorans]|uniref:Methionine synthase II (Cobalamin-independent) n=1 Tax=Nocardioides aromaticivorans TaxID=200618 RepID=A0A7Y9ZFW6_9ACTN|nr:methionine synthase [Nocardioides aromaticivorans]NYI43523.1 methionine synthase II (cobalamin-independent) [Nocardioides aromaticivorans]
MTVRATGVGSFPGDSQRDFDEALSVVLGELAADGGIPFLPEVPGRGAVAAMTGRSLGLVGELDADLQPSGWRLTGTSGAPTLDQRRARSLVAQDLDTFEERMADYAGPVKVQLAGPWTLAATVERPRGDKLLADHGARRDLAQALAVAVADHVADVRRRVPGATGVVLQLDEPALPAVLAGAVPTASGFGKHRTVHPPEASEALEWVLGAAGDAGAEPWVHCCAPDVPLGLLRGAGARGVMVDLALLGAEGHDAAAEALEAGDTIALGVVPTSGAMPSDKALVERVRRWLDMVGLDPAVVGERIVVTPACGLAGSAAADARRATELVRSVARSLGAG